MAEGGKPETTGAVSGFLFGGRVSGRCINLAACGQQAGIAIAQGYRLHAQRQAVDCEQRQADGGNAEIGPQRVEGGAAGGAQAQGGNAGAAGVSTASKSRKRAQNSSYSGSRLCQASS